MLQRGAAAMSGRGQSGHWTGSSRNTSSATAPRQYPAAASGGMINILWILNSVSVGLLSTNTL